ncbi:MAG: glycine cleavage system aminomethyltransferase GcvT [Rhodocyclaceae bacterium]|nr:glycine cleavage system aminomethyltransferase GcvT [Rhodocyclaceae bacterium]
MSVFKRTPLFEAHGAAGGKMVDFAGWEMPIHYGSQIEEHHAVRRDAGLFDVSHMGMIDIRGCEAQSYLRRLLANDVAKLTVPGKALYSCLLQEDGGILDDLIVYGMSATHYRMVVNAGTRHKDMDWMRLQASDFAVSLTAQHDRVILALQGPKARERFLAAFPEARTTEALEPFQAIQWENWFIARTGYTGEDGFEIALPKGEALDTWNKLVAAGLRPCGLGARDTLRLEAGMNLYGQDMDEARNPLESGLKWTVDLSDTTRDFIGKKALEVWQPITRFVGLILQDRGGVLRAHQKIITKWGEGETTSGSFSPTLNQSIALARVPLGVQYGDEVQVEIRDKQLKAKVVKLPFVRHGKVLA